MVRIHPAPPMKLGDQITNHFRISPIQEKGLKKLRIETVKDLLYHFPSRYDSAADISTISNLTKGGHAVVFGTISGLKTSKAFRKKIPMAEGFLEDNSGRIKIIWFHQAYLAKMISENSFVRVEGKVSERKSQLYFSNPKVEPASNLFVQGNTRSLYPIYPESRGITSNWLYHAVKKILSRGALDILVDPIPEDILKTYKLPNLRTSLIWIHTPKKVEHADVARKRFAFEEIFFIQLERQKTRQEFRKLAAFVIDKRLEDLKNFIERFPFEATGGQIKCIGHILNDFGSGHPMSRLLEGDVGSGKTAVAVAAAYAVVKDKFQVAYMAPTEILARQHFESFIKYFRHLPTQIALITSSGCLKFPSKVNPSGWTTISKTQLLKWVANGEIAVVIGTHTLIQKSVKFKQLALAIVDEQHRFGTAQRQKLVSKDGIIPHLLSMTATPIPRTLALTLYGDLDLSLLDEMPAGRKKIITEIVTPDRRFEAYEKVREELAAGRQLYVICPRIDEPDSTKELAIQAKSVKEEAKRLKKDIFPEYEIEILHSKMKPIEKEKVMSYFQNKKIDILVATSVVEVGVNVENASLIIIEGTEHFGLAQLHQLRGRVLRGTHQSYCFVFAETKSEKTVERLGALKTAKSGFELAEFDLKSRGAGELAGTKQWGLSDLGMEAIKNIKMVEAARKEALEFIKKNPDIKLTGTKIHFE